MKYAYVKCKCRSKDRLLIKQLQTDGFNVIVTKGNPEMAAKARAFGVRLPFKVENGKAVEL